MLSTTHVLLDNSYQIKLLKFCNIFAALANIFS